MFTVIEKGQCQLISNKRNSVNDLSSVEKKDTSGQRKVKSNDSILIYYFTTKDSSRNLLDSSIRHLHDHPTLKAWDTDLGNYGSVAKSFLFDPALQPGNKLGIISNESSRYTQNDIKFYNTTRPYSKIYYRFGTKQEQTISLLHSRNIKPNLNITFDYRKIGSPGSYNLQRTNNDNFSTSSNYFSLNGQYKLLASMTYNKMQQDENGGVISEDYLNYSNYNNKRLIPVNFDKKPGETNRSNMTNYYRDLSIQFQHEYFIGKKDSLYNSDSSEKVYSFKPQFGLKHHFYTLGSLYSFKDLTPDSVYYVRTGDTSFRAGDSLFSKYRYSRIGNAFSLLGNVRLKEKTMGTEVGLGIEFDRYKNLFLYDQYIHNYLFARINKTALVEKEWLYDANLKFYYSGRLIGNFLFSAIAGRNFNDHIGQVRIGLDQSIQNPPLMNAQYSSNYYTFPSLSAKQSITKLNFSYLNKIYNVYGALNYFLIANYIYRDTTLNSKVYQQIFPFTQLDLFKTLQYKRFTLDNHILLQFVSAKVPINLPLFAAISSISYQNSILKKKLNISTGIECRYNTAFNADNYVPELYSFVTQDNRQISNFPRFTGFFNFKVKSFRGSLSVDQVQQLFTRNMINYAMYPGQNFMIRFGFHWSFVN